MNIKSQNILKQVDKSECSLSTGKKNIPNWILNFDFTFLISDLQFKILNLKFGI